MIYQQAAGGNTLAAFFYLKAHRPKYRDRLSIDIEQVQSECADVVERPDVTIPGRWSDLSIQIWPANGDVIWPPPFVLDDEGLDLFSNRWTTLPRQP